MSERRPPTVTKSQYAHTSRQKGTCTYRWWLSFGFIGPDPAQATLALRRSSGPRGDSSGGSFVEAQATLACRPSSGPRGDSTGGSFVEAQATLASMRHGRDASVSDRALAQASPGKPEQRG